MHYKMATHTFLQRLLVSHRTVHHTSKHSHKWCKKSCIKIYKSGTCKQEFAQSRLCGWKRHATFNGKKSEITVLSCREHESVWIWPVKHKVLLLETSLSSLSAGGAQSLDVRYCSVWARQRRRPRKMTERIKAQSHSFALLSSFLRKNKMHFSTERIHFYNFR